jgi:two-component system, NarL family, sensor kinase
MKLSKTRVSFFLTMIFGLLLLSESAAQSDDTIGIAIDHILKERVSVVKRALEVTQKDSAALSECISKASYFRSVNYDSSLLYTRKALNISLRMHSLKFVSLAEQNLGDYYLSKERFQDALACYLKCIDVEEARSDRLRLADIYLQLGKTYYFMEMFQQSLDYETRALEIYANGNDTSGIANTYAQLGNLHSSREFCEKRSKEEKKKDFTIAIDYFKKSEKQYLLSGSKEGMASLNISFASIYNKIKRPDIALGYIQKALAYYRSINDPASTSDALYVMGKTYRRLREYDKSVSAFKESEAIGKANHLYQGIQFLYEAMATTLADKGDYKQAYQYYIRYMTIRDSIYNSEKSRQFIELETKYQSEVRQNQILKLISEKRGRNNLIYILAGVIILLAVFIYYHVRLLKQNKIIANQKIEIRENKILELEKERVYLAARSVLEGEEAERSRLAGDLHNGLGGLLSGIKLNLSAMKENSVITHENISAFNHALSLLDTSISELRRIAHNLMPETLTHYGLKTALEDFCLQVSPAGRPEINVRFFGDEIRYTKELELTMYRIIQELVNNSLKHASATLITIQVFSEPQRLVAQVIDNGCGFDNTGNVYTGKGKGLENIYNRVTAINGKLDIWSEPGQGAEISIEIEIP